MGLQIFSYFLFVGVRSIHYRGCERKNSVAGRLAPACGLVGRTKRRESGVSQVLYFAGHAALFDFALGMLCSAYIADCIAVGIFREYGRVNDIIDTLAYISYN